MEDGGWMRTPVGGDTDYGTVKASSLYSPYNLNTFSLYHSYTSLISVPENSLPTR